MYKTKSAIYIAIRQEMLNPKADEKKQVKLTDLGAINIRTDI